MGDFDANQDDQTDTPDCLYNYIPMHPFQPTMDDCSVCQWRNNPMAAEPCKTCEFTA